MSRPLLIPALFWIAACSHTRPVPDLPTEKERYSVQFACDIMGGCLRTTRNISLRGEAALTLQGVAASLTLSYRQSETLSPSSFEPEDRHGPVRHVPASLRSDAWYGVAERSGESVRIDLLTESRHCPPREGAATPACYGDRAGVRRTAEDCHWLAQAGAPLHLTRDCRVTSLTCSFKTLDVTVSERYHEKRTYPERLLVCETKSWLPILLSRIPFSAVEGLRVRSFNPSTLPVDRFEVFRPGAGAVR